MHRVVAGRIRSGLAGINYELMPNKLKPTWGAGQSTLHHWLLFPGKDMMFTRPVPLARLLLPGKDIVKVHDVYYI